jgi:serine/threonine-protein kinase
MAGNPRVLGLLEEMLDSGKTPEEACRDCPELLPEVRQRWQAFCHIDAEIGALLPGLRTRSDAGAPAPPATGLPQVPGYEVEAVLGRGGMGVVYRARHLALKRTVALKMLAAGHPHPAERARFTAEAEAVARLQHPNIVQIHEVGEAAGLPFLALEYVAGGSLAERLAGRPLPPDDAAGLVAALAGAMHLAHSRNLVHRDLKPANVLLAGEPDTPVAQCQPKVTDFGLVRQLDADSGQTHVGLVIGTPSYMAPEQAEGRAHAAGPAADVYALGAILYECLTGRPPFRGATSRETLEQVRTHEPAAPSALNRQVPRDLETICLKCLRKQPERRYSSARELADDLGRFVRGEPVAARPVGAAERAAKWVRRRPAAAGLLAAVGLLLAAGAVGTWLVAEQRAADRDRQDRTDEEVRRVLEHARDLLDRGWQAADLATLTEAGAEGNRALGMAHSGGASGPVRREAEAFRDDAKDRLGRAGNDRTLLQELLDVSAPQGPWALRRDRAGRIMVLDRPSADEQFADAFRRWGLDVDGTPEDDVVARLGAEPEVVVQELIAALDGWMMERRRQGRPQAEWRRLFRVADQLDRNERHRRLRALLVRWSLPRAESVAGLVGVGSPWPTLWELARGDGRQRLREVRREIDPRTDPVLTVLLLAQAHDAVGDAAGAEQVLREAATVRPDQVVLLTALGNLLERQGPSRRGKAIEYYRAARARRPRLGLGLSGALVRAGRADEAEEVLRELIRQQPDSPALYNNLGASLHAQQKYGAAEAACQKAIELKPDYAGAHYNLGNALSQLQKPGAAEAAYRRAIELQPDYAYAYNNLATVLNNQQRYGEAEALLRKALDLDPDFAYAHNNLGTALYGQQRYGEAEAAYRKAIDLSPGYSVAYHNLGRALRAQGKNGDAVSAFRKAIDLEPDYVEACCGLGDVLLAQQNYSEAEAAFRKAIRLQPRHADAYFGLGNALTGQKRHAEAEAAFRKAIDLRPDFADAYFNLGNALTAQGEHGAAEAAYRKAIDLRPGFAGAYNNLGMALIQRQKPGAAEAAFRKAIDLRPDSADAYNNLGMALGRQRKHGEAEAAFRKAIALRPDFALAHFNLAQTLTEQARFDEGLALVKKGNDLLPAGDPLREQARQFEQQCQRYVILDARRPAILRGTEKPASAAEQLEFAELCRLKKLYAAAARFYGDAFTAEPKLAEAVPTGARYNAACAAARAGCGQGRDADTLDDKGRARWRRQAREWLRQDLTWWGKALDKGDAQTKADIRGRMQYWQTDSDLAGLREPGALEALPPDERKECLALWQEVAALLSRAQTTE